jgi:hypothetical protein
MRVDRGTEFPPGALGEGFWGDLGAVPVGVQDAERRAVQANEHPGGPTAGRPLPVRRNEDERLPARARAASPARNRRTSNLPWPRSGVRSTRFERRPNAPLMLVAAPVIRSPSSGAVARAGTRRSSRTHAGRRRARRALRRRGSGAIRHEAARRVARTPRLAVNVKNVCGAPYPRRAFSIRGRSAAPSRWRYTACSVRDGGPGQSGSETAAYQALSLSGKFMSRRRAPSRSARAARTTWRRRRRRGRRGS